MPSTGNTTRNLVRVTQGLKESDIEDLEICLVGKRMFMIMEVSESFSFEKKTKADQQNPKMQAWEQLIWRFQQALPDAKPREKWLRMERICKNLSCQEPFGPGCEIKH